MSPLDPRVIRARKRIRNRHRGRDGSALPPFDRVYVRLCEIETVLRDHAPFVSDDIISKRVAKVVAHHYRILAAKKYLGITDTLSALAGWCGRWTPNLSMDCVRSIAVDCDRVPVDYSDDKVADELRLTYEVRTRLGIKCIGACDMTKADRLEQSAIKKKARDRDYAEKQRRKKEQLSRADYLKKVASLKPWIDEGISERTWRRRKRNAKILAAG